MKQEKNLETIRENYDCAVDELEKANWRNRTLEDLNNEQIKSESGNELIEELDEEVSSLKSKNSPLREKVAEQNHNFEDQRKSLEGKYSCRQCNYQTTYKGDLARHKKAVHEEVKFSCSQCNYQAIAKGSLAQHKRAVHKGAKYSCGQCNLSSNSKGRSY